MKARSGRGEPRRGLRPEQTLVVLDRLQDDAVQEAYLRWQRASEDEVRSSSAYLSKVVARLCIDRLRSARVRREQYVGPWLPEPVLGEQAQEIRDQAELEDSLSMAFLVLPESLTPVERTVFVLRDVFDYEYAEIASLVGKSEGKYLALHGLLVPLVHRLRGDKTMHVELTPAEAPSQPTSAPSGSHRRA